MTVAPVTQLSDLYQAQYDALTKHVLETGKSTKIYLSKFMLLLFLHCIHLLFVTIVGISAPQLVDVDWRLDYHVRSKLGGKENKPVYFLVLKVREHGLIRDIQMMASLEDVQDLAGKVKDALKQVDRVLTSKSD